MPHQNTKTKKMAARLRRNLEREGYLESIVDRCPCLHVAFQHAHIPTIVVCPGPPDPQSRLDYSNPLA